MNHYISIALVFSFSLFTTCAFVFFISGAYLLLFKINDVNKAFKHPYLTEQPFGKYPLGIRMAILLDYFLHMMFPKSRIWLAGHANLLLAHVDTKRIPWNLKWPIAGLWAGCFIGMIAMMVLWAIILSGAAK
jgi:hypothetical protein